MATRASELPSMRFCVECNNMLYPKEDKEQKVLMYECHRCLKTQDVPVEEYRVYRHELKGSEVSFTGYINWKQLAKDPTLPRTRAIHCRDCDNREAVIVQASFGASETSEQAQKMSLQFICTKCYRQLNK